MKQSDLKEMREQAKTNPWILQGQAFDEQRAKQRYEQYLVDERRKSYLKKESSRPNSNNILGGRTQKLKNWR